MRFTLSAAAAWLCLAMAAPSAEAQPALDKFDALRPSAEITAALARRDVNAAAAAASKMMASTSRERLRDVFQIVRGFGESQYSDLVYARDYGKTEKDIIYKIDFEKAFIFVRFLYHVDNGDWRLIHIHLKTEDEQPFPKDWVHIYPQ
jgi:hypothetical protein